MYHECQATSIYLVPFVVPVYRRRTAYYIQTCDSEYDLTIYFGAGGGGWMNSKSNIRGEVTVARADQLQEVIMASVTQ